MLGPSTIITETREALVSVIESTAVRTALKKGYDVVIDAHHLNPKVIAKWKEYVDHCNTQLDQNIVLEFNSLDTPLDTCIARDSKRPGDMSVGSKVIINLHNKYLRSTEYQWTSTMTSDDMEW